jgi:hypothetical protein
LRDASVKTPARQTIHGLLVLLVLGLSAVRPASGASNRLSLATGIVFDHFSRTITWDEDEAGTKMSVPVISLRQAMQIGDDLTLALSASLSLADIENTVFRGLPISLEYDAGAMKGLALGAEARYRFMKSGDFEIKGMGRIVSSFGIARTWPMEGFAVPGESIGRLNWTEVSFGPEAAYLFFGKFVPSIEVSARWLWVGFKMDQTLDGLQGTETKSVKADFGVGVSLRGEYQLSRHITLTAKAGILPYPGGVDSMASAGFHYAF